MQGSIQPPWVISILWARNNVTPQKCVVEGEREEGVSGKKGATKPPLHNLPSLVQITKRIQNRHGPDTRTSDRMINMGSKKKGKEE